MIRVERIRQLAERALTKKVVINSAKLRQEYSAALLAFAAMVERCEKLLKDYDLYGSVSEANKQKCDLLRKHVNYILKGATDERK